MILEKHSLPMTAAGVTTWQDYYGAKETDALIREAREIIKRHLVICQILNRYLGGTEATLRDEPGYQEAQAWLDKTKEST